MEISKIFLKVHSKNLFEACIQVFFNRSFLLLTFSTLIFPVPIQADLFDWPLTVSTAVPNSPGLKKSSLSVDKNEMLKNRPVEFLENKGQMMDDHHQPVPYVLFLAEAPGVNMYVTEKGLSYVLLNAKEEKKKTKKGVIEEEEMEIDYEKVEMELVGAAINKQSIIKEDPSIADFVYYNGSRKEDEYHAKKYGKITFTNVYPGIDWVLYNSGSKGFKYDFIVHPGADPRQIQLNYKSIRKPQLNAQGNLDISVGKIGTLCEEKPASYIEGSGKIVESNFKVIAQQKKHGLYQTLLSFNFPEHPVWHSQETLVVDPQLYWATFFGSNGADGPFSIATDQSGNVYIGGYNLQANNFPLQTYGSYNQANPNNGWVVKFSATGTLLWATYFGNSSVSVSYLCVDKFSNLYVVGTTGAGGIPVVNAGTYYQAVNAGLMDNYIWKFNSTGTVVWCTYFGGSGSEYVYSIACDPKGNIVMAGGTDSPNFPLLNAGGYFDGTLTYPFKGWIAKFDNLGNLVWSSYLKGIVAAASGGLYVSAGPVVGTDRLGNIYLTGSQDINQQANNQLPVLNPGGGAYFQSAAASNNWPDCYIFKFDTLYNQVWTTFYGGTANDGASNIACDKWGNVFVLGATNSTDFPLQNAGGCSYFQPNPTSTSDRDAFILKFSPTGVRLWATRFGSTTLALLEGTASNDNIAIDTCGNVYVGIQSGYKNMPVMSSCDGGFLDIALDTTAIMPGDQFIARFTNQGKLTWATYLGGDGLDFRTPLALDPSGNLFVAGEWNSVTNNATYPLTNPGGGAYNSLFTGGDDCFIAKFINQAPATLASQSFSYTGPYCVNDTNQLPVLPNPFPNCGLFGSSAGLSLNPNTGLITPSLSVQGTYTVSYRIPNCGCNGIPDQVLAQATVAISGQPISIVTSSSLICSGKQATLTASGASNYTWNPGGNGASIIVAPTVSGTYSAVGSNSLGCNATGTISITVFTPTLSVSVTPSVICAGKPTTLTASGAITYTWNPAGNGSSVVITPTISGTYSVAGNDSQGCNTTGTISLTVFTPSLSISVTPGVVCAGIPATLTASGLSTYTWNPAGNSTSIVITPTVSGTYSAAGTDSVGCNAAGTISITAFTVPSPSISATPSVICIGRSTTLTASGASTYSWSTGAASSTVVLSPMFNTNYSVNATSSAGCVGTTSIHIVVERCLGIGDIAGDKNGFKVFPNPSNGEFTIEASREMNLVLVDEAGKLIRKISLNNSSLKLTVSNIAAGIYFLYNPKESLDPGLKIIIEN